MLSEILMQQQQPLLRQTPDQLNYGRATAEFSLYQTTQNTGISVITFFGNVLPFQTELPFRAAFLGSSLVICQIMDPHSSLKAQRQRHMDPFEILARQEGKQRFKLFHQCTDFQPSKLVPFPFKGKTDGIHTVLLAERRATVTISVHENLQGDDGLSPVSPLLQPPPQLAPAFKSSMLPPHTVHMHVFPKLTDSRLLGGGGDIPLFLIAARVYFAHSEILPWPWLLTSICSKILPSSEISPLHYAPVVFFGGGVRVTHEVDF